mgnify:CR=1 FL=1
MRDALINAIEKLTLPTQRLDAIIMKNFKEVYSEAGFDIGNMQVLVDCGDNPKAYNSARQVFNQRFQFRPWAIVYPKSAQDVSNLVRFATIINKELRIRGGGHDHEGECSATDALVLDMRHMDKAEVDHQAGVARIQPGGIFMNLIKVLNANNVGIPHGTCQTVGITGYTMGGGWGPWTRKQGMCCESLAGATIVLGDGTIKELHEDTSNEADKELLWAIRGGGGYSYGVITELVIKTFPLPKVTHKFTASWTTKPALEVLAAWEHAIDYNESPNLVGTNLQIFAKPADGQPIEKSIHDCNFFGYYAGTEADIEAYIKEYFGNVPPDHLEILPETEDHHLQFTSWERVSLRRRRALKSGAPLTAAVLKDFPLEDDIPAPHKITSRLVNEGGLGSDGQKNLIKSLESPLIFEKGEELGVLAYTTLGAISGSFYRDYDPANHPIGSAFPYKKRPFTIQYQVWWDTDPDVSPETSEYEGVNVYTNRAMDWIEETRKMDFPQTSGSFISFKDDGVPTENYFMESYDDLVRIKKKYSKDPDNRFRSRKTII